jgi:penicillin-binding protein 2
VLSERGVIYDRNGTALAWNDETRAYTPKDGFGHLLGYVNLPRADEVESKNVLAEERIGRDGTERMFDDMLRGSPGTKIIEVDVNNAVQSESVFQPAVDGESVTLSIDARVEEELYRVIKSVALERGYSGGAGAIMDVRTGEMLAITSYPEYSPAAFFDPARKAEITSYVSDPNKPFLNRATQGIYTPGSIMKPFVALAALQEKVVTPEKVIYTDGVLEYPNPYDPKKPTLFPDWKNHGPVNMYDALAVSSDIYFYEVGGGFGTQAGVGIDKLKKYFTLFGFDATTGSAFPGEAEGLIPDREWKLRTQGAAWGVADTYHTSIGQYSVLVTPLQMVRAISAVANGGTLLTPTLLASTTPQGISIPIEKEHFTDVQKGMRDAVTRGTATGLSVPFVQVAAKTGTAEIDYAKKYVNAWITGFFPYKNPHYAFVVVMERGPRTNTIGGVFVMRQMLDWMNQNTPEYFK